jgi:hypothetical protein
MYRCNEYEDGVYETTGHIKKCGDEEESRSPSRARSRFRSLSPCRHIPSENSDQTSNPNEPAEEEAEIAKAVLRKNCAEEISRRSRLSRCSERGKCRRDGTYARSGAIPLPRLTVQNSAITAEDPWMRHAGMHGAQRGLNEDGTVERRDFGWFVYVRGELGEKDGMDAVGGV